MSETFQSNNLLTEEDNQALMEAIGDAVMQAIKTGDSVFVSFPRYNLILMVVQEDFSIQSSLFLLSDCVKNEEGQLQLPMPPLYAGRRHIMNIEDFEGYYNEEAVKQLEPKVGQALFLIMNLLRTIQLGSGVY
ncbi:hypothetical protein [Ectobacillus funiculus]|uniref:DUF2487 family protein n=1 Tax=Ectobacillus funiculus TaxID=137993 RepID=A0ABV5WA25_9BACI